MAGSKKLTGRPKLEKDKREKFINVRFTTAEYELILAMEKELGISKTDLIRMRTLDKAAGIVMNARELISNLDGIGSEMGRIGNNINQLARHANTLNLQGGLNPFVAEHFNHLMELYIERQLLLETSLRRIIRMMNNQ
jgi:hypothetical protein